MNRTRLKNYAPQARRDFIQAMTDRAAYYGLTANHVEPMVERGDVAVMAGREFPRAVAQKRKALEERIQRQGFAATMEALAYTWFNRLVAIRYMELRGYLDHGYRVLSAIPSTETPEPRKDTELHGSKTEEKSSFRVSSVSFRGPEILQYAEYVDLPGLKPETVIDLKLDGNKEAELYRLILVAQCNALHRVMPFLFERIDDETELLLPDNLLHSDSLIRTLVNNLDEGDCESVEVLGWLYQFYIAERKDQVMGRKSAVPTEDIPAVTQLFTPHWIVRYLVENSLGRLWLLNRPGSRLREQMPYYIEGEPETDFLQITRPEDIRLCDPAVGSGHMLTYAFDLLTLIYQEEGYAPAEIPALILRHNLYGLEICPRAAQLAGLALVFKAREKSRRFFQPEHLVRPHIIELCDVRFAENELRDYRDALGLGDLFDQPLLKLLHQFEEAKNFGSLIQPCLDKRTIAFVRDTIAAKDLGGQLFLRETHLKVLRVLEQAEALTQRYHIVVANPPFMGGKNQNAKLKDFLRSNYSGFGADIFSAFIERVGGLVTELGEVGIMSPFVWMFLSSYESVRLKLTSQWPLRTLIQPEYHAFFSSAYVPLCAFTFTIGGKHGLAQFIKLTNFYGEELQPIKMLEAIRDPNCKWRYRLPVDELTRIPGCPIAYWVTAKFRSVFTGKMIRDVLTSDGQILTGNNEKFLRYFWEVEQRLVGAKNKWKLHHKGGEFRKWYGNVDWVVAWDNKTRNYYRSDKTARIPKEYLWDLEGVTWSTISSSKPSFRIVLKDESFNKAAPTLSSNDSELIHVALACLNSEIATYCLSVLNPTLNYLVQDVESIPICLDRIDRKTAENRARNCIAAAKADWDNFETSWDFRDLPLLRPGLKGATLEASWRNWEAHCTAAICRMQELETENNRLFIAAYGLEGELQPEVPEAQITLARPDARRDIAAFLSYAIGCMMGRYRLDQSGLIYAHSSNVDFEKIYSATDTHGRNTEEKQEGSFSVSIPCPSVAKFFPDEDGIIPLLQTDWGFPDDATLRTHEFLRATFGEATLNDNLRFIEEALGKDLRKYFLTDFYKDHLQTYKKRPIYWLFSSGKQRAFQCLVYLHRYHVGTLARMRTEYVIPLQGRISARIDQLEGDKVKATSTSHRKQLQKEQDDLKKQQAELAVFEEKLKHAADQKISLDLDDGVKVNYGKFGDLLAESKAITGGKDDD